ncbi:Variant surface glycoprotein, partial [Trypanosoma congolense IL3000]
MWMMVKIATWLLLWIGSGAWLGMDGPVLRISARNEVAGKLLCDAFQAAEDIRKHVNMSQEMRERMKMAVYGAPGATHFTEDGRLGVRNTFPSEVQYGRHTLCEYYSKNSPTKDVDGVFAQSLFGTFVCVCAPPITDRNAKLCGVRHWERRRAWSGYFNRGKIDKYLLQDVWLDVIKKCTAPVKNQESDLNRVARLARALEAVRNGVRLYRPNGEFLYILGEFNDIRGCSGRNANDICAAYHQRVGRWGIPWEQRLRHVLQELYARFEKPKETRAQESISWSNSAAPETYLPPLPPITEVLVDDEGQKVVVQDEDIPEDVENTTGAGLETENHTSVNG